MLAREYHENAGRLGHPRHPRTVSYQKQRTDHQKLTSLQLTAYCLLLISPLLLLAP